jgi:hypothetical protein
MRACSPSSTGSGGSGNMALYDDRGFVSQRDAEQALEAARDYLRLIRKDVARRQP